MAHIVRVILSLSISGSILMLVTLVLCRLTTNKFRKSWHYYIWLVVVIRLLLPLTPDGSLVGSAGDRFIHQATVFHNENAKERSAPIILGDNVNIGSNVQLGNNNSFFAVIGWPIFVLAIWLAVAAALFLHKVTKYQSFFKYIKASWEPVEDPQVLNQLHEACASLGVTKIIDVYTNRLISSPMLIGVRRSYIVLPHLQISPENLYYIFLHEVSHEAKKDIFYKWIIQFTICLHWFNPLVYLLSKKTTAACEFSCDEYAVQHLNDEEIKQYGTALIAMLDTKGNYKESIAAVSLHENAQEVKTRLQALIHYPKYSRTMKIISALIVALLIAFGYWLGI